MKQLQNNFTTPEQIGRLLKLGLPANSADCVLISAMGNMYVLIRRFADEEKVHNDALPCWSVGRLMEIYLICKSEKSALGLHFSNRDDWDDNIVDSICDLFETGVRCEYLDFSRLED